MTFRLALAALLIGFSAMAADWPMYGADSQRSHATDAAITLPLAVAWRYQTGQAPRPAWPQPGKELHRLDFDYCFQPVIAGGLLYFGSSADDALRAVDLATGALRWRFVADGPIRFAPVVAAGRCYVAADSGQLYCLDASDGRLQWQFAGGRSTRLVLGNGRLISRWPLRSGVVVVDGIAYFTVGMWPSEGVYAYALDAASGEVRWRNDTCGRQFLSYAHKPSSSIGGLTPQGYILSGGTTLLIPTGRSLPAGMDRQSGKLLYCNTQIEKNWWHGGAWATIYGDMFFNASTNGTIPFSSSYVGEAQPTVFDGHHAYELTTGEHARQHALRVDYYKSNDTYRLLAAEGVLYQLELDALSAVSLADPADRKLKRGIWRVPYPGRRGYAMARSAAYLFVGDRDQAFAFDINDGEMVWQTAVRGEVRGIALADDTVVLSTDTGELLCLQHGSAESRLIAEATATDASQPTGAAADILKRIEATGMRRGYGVIVGALPQVTRALAEATELQLLELVDDEAAVAPRRAQLLDGTSWYGSRIAVLPRQRLRDLPARFANLVIVDDGAAAAEVRELLQPYSGMLCVAADGAEIGAQLTATGLRGAEKAGAVWYASPPVVAEKAVSPPLEMLWFGGPGPARMADRHIVNSPRPKGAAGRYFVIGEHYVMGVDAFNGTELWSRPIRDACTRDRPIYAVKNNVSSRAITMTVDADRVRFHLGADVNLDLAPQTGEVIDLYGAAAGGPRFGLQQAREFALMRAVEGLEEKPIQHWQPVAVGGEVTREVTARIGVEATADEVIVTLRAYDLTESIWDRWDLYFDFRPAAQRVGLYEQGAFSAAVYPPAVFGRGDSAIYAWYFPRAVDDFPKPEKDETATKPAWSVNGAGPLHPQLSVTGTRGQETSEVTVRLSRAELAKSFDWRGQSFEFAAALRLDGAGNVDEPPIYFYCDESAARVNSGWPTFDLTSGDDGVIAEPGSTAPAMPTLEDHPPSDADLARDTVPTYRLHPLTGMPTKRLFRPSYGCAFPVSIGQTSFFRSGTMAFYDYEDDSGVRFIPGVRPGCQGNSSILPALGLLIYSERSSGCACSYNFQTSFAMAPAQQPSQDDWAVFYDLPADAPIRMVYLNLGAPGDRRDADANLWLGFPRPSNPYNPAMEVPVTMDTDEGAVPYRFSGDFRSIAETDRPWLYSCGQRGVRRVVFDLRRTVDAIARTAEASPTIDGELTDTCWLTADGETAVPLPLRMDAITTYYQQHWDRIRIGENMTDWCTLRYHGETLYFACYDTPEVDRLGKAAPWPAKYPENDGVRFFNDDYYSIYLTDDREQVVLQLSVNASGGRYDTRISGAPDAAEADLAWTDEWVSQVKADEDGFRAEIAVPLAALARAGLDPKSLRVNLACMTGSRAYGPRSLLPLGRYGLARPERFAPVGIDGPRPAPSRPFTVELHFAEVDDVAVGDRVFDVRLQGQTVLQNFDVLQAAGGRDTAVVRTFRGITAAEELVVELYQQAPAVTPGRAPVLSAVAIADETFKPPALVMGNEE